MAARGDRPSPVGPEARRFGASPALVALVAISVTGKTAHLFLGITLSAAAAILWRLFPDRSSFSLTFTNLVAVYASVFADFLEELFAQIGSIVSGVGF